MKKPTISNLCETIDSEIENFNSIEELSNTEDLKIPISSLRHMGASKFKDE